jgi:hypothetical protein
LARIRWRHAIGAAKCIARMREDANDSDDDDAQYEFKFTEVFFNINRYIRIKFQLLPMFVNLNVTWVKCPVK